MSAELYALPDDAEGRVIECLNENTDDGISAFAMCTRLGVKFRPLTALLKRLQSEGRARLVQRKGAAYWYPSLDTLSPPPKRAAPEEQTVKKRRGRPPVNDGKARAKCPIDGCGTMIRLTKDAMVQHLLRMHGLDVRERVLTAEAWLAQHAGEAAAAVADHITETLLGDESPEFERQCSLVRGIEELARRSGYSVHTELRWSAEQSVLTVLIRRPA